MKQNQHLDWDGGFNIRDLGEISTKDGRKTKRGRVVRSGNLHLLSKDGWQALESHGIRTIIDLRNQNERDAELYSTTNAEISCVHIPIEEERDQSDVEFWQEWRKFNCSPLYYAAFIRQYKKRISDVISQIASAQAGGVLFHCGIGRDRTGLIAMILLNLIGASHDEIVQDFEASAAQLRPNWERIGRKNDESGLKNLLLQQQISAADSILSTLEELDSMAILDKSFISSEIVEELQKRILE